MANTIDKITVSPDGIVMVREITDAGGYYRSAFHPGQDVSDQPQEIQEACANAWTSEIIAAYQADSAKAIIGA